MKNLKKCNLFGYILSEGSFRFILDTNKLSQQTLDKKKIDVLNHPVWTGRRPKEQTEIAAFISRLK